MREIGAFDAKNKLGALLKEVEKGEEIVITRNGKPVARLVPEATFVDRGKARQAMISLFAARRGVTLGQGVTIKGLIAEGRP